MRTKRLIPLLLAVPLAAFGEGPVVKVRSLADPSSPACEVVGNSVLENARPLHRQNRFRDALKKQDELWRAAKESLNELCQMVNQGTEYFRKHQEGMAPQSLYSQCEAQARVAFLYSVAVEAQEAAERKADADLLDLSDNLAAARQREDAYLAKLSPQNRAALTRELDRIYPSAGHHAAFDRILDILRRTKAHHEVKKLEARALYEPAHRNEERCSTANEPRDETPPNTASANATP